MKAFKSKSCSKAACNEASAYVVDGKLILSYPHARTPVVWQMDLTQTKASALEVLENKTDGSFTLTLKTPKGESVEIAPFEKRAQAVEALMAASRALQSSAGQIRPSENAPIYAQTSAPARKSSRTGRVAAAILGLLLRFVLFSIWSVIANAPQQISAAGGSPASTSGESQSEAGVPQSADDFLNAR